MDLDFIYKDRLLEVHIYILEWIFKLKTKIQKNFKLWIIEKKYLKNTLANLKKLRFI